MKTLSGLRRRIARSRFARVAAFPGRTGLVGKHLAKVLEQSGRWLIQSREHTNLSYDLTPLNMTHLAWWVAGVAGITVGEARGYIQEALDDRPLHDHVRRATLASDRRGLADGEVRLHKRLGWYALLRALKPGHVVETGTDKGLGSVVIAAALLRNGSGRLTTMDVNPDAGYLISGAYAEVVTVVLGDSVKSLRDIAEPIDFFLHDSLHTREHELAELHAVSPNLSEGAWALSDNAHVTDALPTWAEATGRAFTYFQERPANHWYPGGGIGIAQ